MTVQAIAALTVYNLALAGVGSALLFGVRPNLTTLDFIRLGGLSYLLGVAVAMIAFTTVIVLDIPLGWASMVVCALVVVGAGIFFGLRRRSLDARSEVRFSLVLPSAAVLALVVVTLEAIFRKGRLQGLGEFDGWDSWGPKAKALYFFGKLDPHFLDDIAGGSYPPGLPALLAGALHSIGSADVVTVHLQYWFLGVGFVAAMVGLLAGRVEPMILLPFALLVFVMPDIRARSIDMYGDLPLGFAIAMAALLLALWLEDRADWQIAAAAILCAGATLTKREGLVLAAALVAATFLASLDRLRQVWLRLVAVLAAAWASWVLWQIWLSAHDLHGSGPSGGLHFLRDPARGWDALHRVVDNVFQFDLWLVSMSIAIAAIGLCLLVRAWRIAVCTASLLGLLIMACTVILWSEPNLQLNDVDVVSRLVGTVALTAVAITPLALQSAWGGLPRVWNVPVWHRALGWGAIGAAAIAYPASLLADGGARFPKASDCVQPGSIGYADSYPAALRLRDRVTANGDSNGIVIVQDGCGRLRVERSH
jgi:hypothetical protein